MALAATLQMHMDHGQNDSVGGTKANQHHKLVQNYLI